MPSTGNSRALIEELDDLRPAPDVRVVTLSGAGRVFCAGSDLVAMWVGPPDPGRAQWRRAVAGAPAEEARLTGAFGAVLRLFELHCPTVAALHRA